MVLLLTHWVGVSPNLVLPSQPYEYWRKPDHTITDTIFKKEMWVKMAVVFLSRSRWL